MGNKTKTLIAAGVIAVLQASNASAHLEPKEDDGMEKCYGVVKAHKNDCASKATKHGCAGMAKSGGDANEWIKMPEGLCEKLVGGSISPAVDMENENHDDGDDHDHDE